jgi:hypothetical protein
MCMIARMHVSGPRVWKRLMGDGMGVRMYEWRTMGVIVIIGCA